MAKPRIPNQKKMNNALSSRLNRYVARVQSIYDSLNERAARIVESTSYDGGEPFSFSDYPEVRRLVDELQHDFVGQMRGLIHSGTSAEWKESNIVQDLLAKKVLNYYDAELDGERTRVYYQTNSDALRAFQNRAERGMNLSSIVWNQSENYVKGLEYAISSAIQKGMSSVTLSKRISQYLNDFPSLREDYTERYGHAVDCADCEYRSIRLARSEINMACRTAEQTRWKQFDFILGYEIKTSGSHPREDICDELAGKYPKDFTFTGWHPNCMCYCIPIVMSEDDYWRMREGESAIAKPITDLPEKFKDYVRNNVKNINQSAKRGTQPYWIRDNKTSIENAINPSKWKITPEDVEALHGSNFNSFDADSYNKSSIRGFNLTRFDKAMDDIGDSNLIYWSVKKVRIWDNGNATLRYVGKSDGSTSPDVKIERNFCTTERGVEVNHDMFELPQKLQGNGISKELFRNMIREYGDMGVSRVNVYANMDVGGYCWAKYGFCASKDEARRLIEQSRSEGWITPTEYDAAMSIVNGHTGEAFPMNYLANAPFGKRMLQHDSVGWRGFLDFSDRTQSRYMKEYVNYPKGI